MPLRRDTVPDLVVSFSVAKPPREAYEQVVRQLGDSLARCGVRWELRKGGRVLDAGREFGRVSSWAPGRELALRVRPGSWTRSPATILRLRFARTTPGTRITLEVLGWEAGLARAGAKLLDWTAVGVLPELYRQFAPSAFGEWVMDQQARRPSGESALATYRDPVYHWPSFLLILDRLQLTGRDRLLEVGCGGGAFLHRALESGCSATGVDHSAEMVRLARDVNRAAIRTRRLDVAEGDAASLPVATGCFTACACTNVFNFFPDPLLVLREMHRALGPGGRLAIFTDTAAARGTPAAPEPFASRCRFYEPKEIAALAREAGFAKVVVEEPDLGPYARAARLPAKAAGMFEGFEGGLLLLAEKSG